MHSVLAMSICSNNHVVLLHRSDGGAALVFDVALVMCKYHDFRLNDDVMTVELCLKQL